MQRWCVTALILLAPGVSAKAGEPHNPLAAGELPQYIFFNKSPTAEGPGAWHQSRPASFTPETCREIVETIGYAGNARLRFGVHFRFSILEDDARTLAAALRALLAAAEQADVPVLVGLDGQNWWESRSDLWNWWDPNLPGYDPANRHNVEWTGWGPEHAVKIGWRNWGHQFRVRPAPNIAAPRFLAACRERYDVLVPILAEWYRGLPPDRRYLFGGMKVGEEAGININAYYQPDGNRLFEEHPTDDSHDTHVHFKSQGWTFGTVPLGYAAVYTSGFKRAGELTAADIERVIQEYLQRCSEIARQHGVPAHLIFTHQGGTYPPWPKHLSFRPAMNDSSIPGWSIYNELPVRCGSLARDLREAGRHQWAACEWWLGAPHEDGWRRMLEFTLNFESCRFIAVYNWEAFRKLPPALAAARSLAERLCPPATAPATRPAP